MSDMKNYSSNPIDLSWQTAPWNEDGETIKKETENAEGNLNMTELPSEVNADELTDLKEEIIRTAVRNTNLSVGQIEEYVDCGAGYGSKVLRKECPEWYENTFKQTGKSTDQTRDDLRDKETDISSKSSAESLAEETGRDKAEFKPDVEIPDLDDLETVEEPDTSHAHDYRRNTTDSPEWKPYALVAVVGFTLGLLWGGRDD